LALSGQRALETDAIAGDRAGKVARSELALVRADELGAVLLKDEFVGGRSVHEVELQLPHPGDVRRRRLRGGRLVHLWRFGEDGGEAVGHDLLVARLHLVGDDGDTAGGRIGEVDARLRIEEVLEYVLAGDAEFGGVQLYVEL